MTKLPLEIYLSIITVCGPDEKTVLRATCKILWHLSERIVGRLSDKRIHSLERNIMLSNGFIDFYQDSGAWWWFDAKPKMNIRLEGTKDVVIWTMTTRNGSITCNS